MNTNEINWWLKLEDVDTMAAVTDRAMKLFERSDNPPEYLDVIMDLTACHLNGMPLDLAKLLAADDLTFAHDVGGIRAHINRRTGKINDCFVPRTAL